MPFYTVVFDAKEKEGGVFAQWGMLRVGIEAKTKEEAEKKARAQEEPDWAELKHMFTLGGD